MFRESLAINREIGDRQGEADSLNGLGNMATIRGDLAEAERLHRESLAINREIGNRNAEANSMIYLGQVAEIRMDFDETERLLLESMAIHREIGNQNGQAGSMLSSVSSHKREATLLRRERLNHESLAIYRENGNRQDEAASLGNLGNLALERGDLAEAERLFRGVVDPEAKQNRFTEKSEIRQALLDNWINSEPSHEIEAILLRLNDCISRV